MTGIAADHLGNVFVVDEGSLFMPIGDRETCIQKFTYAPTPTRRTTWGELKARYR